MLSLCRGLSRQSFLISFILKFLTLIILFKRKPILRLHLASLSVSANFGRSNLHNLRTCASKRFSSWPSSPCCLSRDSVIASRNDRQRDNKGQNGIKDKGGSSTRRRGAGGGGDAFSSTARYCAVIPVSYFSGKPPRREDMLERVQTGCSPRRDDDRSPRDGQSIRVTPGNVRCRRLRPPTWGGQRIGSADLSIMPPVAGQRIINGRDADPPRVFEKMDRDAPSSCTRL